MPTTTKIRILFCVSIVSPTRTSMRRCYTLFSFLFVQSTAFLTRGSLKFTSTLKMSDIPELVVFDLGKFSVLLIPLVFRNGSKLFSRRLLLGSGNV